MTIQLNVRRWTEIYIVAACIFLFGVSEGRRRALRELQPRITAQNEELARIEQSITDTQGTQARIDGQLRACSELLGAHR